MINPRVLLQLPLLFLGSCMPMTPSTTIVIYTGGDSAPPAQVVTITDDTAKLKRNAAGCQELEMATLRAYTLPKLPDLSNIPPSDHARIAEALLDHIAVLRKEIKKLTEQYKCGLEQSKQQ